MEEGIQLPSSMRFKENQNQSITNFTLENIEPLELLAIRVTRVGDQVI